MAILKCKDCGGQVSSAAKSCPSCGAPAPKRTKMITWCFAAIATYVALQMAFRESPQPPPPKAKTPQEVAAQAAAEQRFQRAKALVLSIKKSMRDPDSLTVERIGASADGSVMCAEYRAKNGFGGMTREFVVARNDKLSQETDVWNKNCRGEMYDVKHALRALD